MTRKVFTVFHEGDELVLVLSCDDGSPEEVDLVGINDKNDMLETIEHCLFNYNGENEHDDAK
jgi:hypothetical protein